MGIPGFVHQADLDWYLSNFCERKPFLPKVGANSKQILCAEIEAHVNRIELNDRREPRRGTGADQFTSWREVACDTPVEGPLNMGLAEVHGCQGAARLRLHYGALRGVALRLSLIERSL